MAYGELSADAQAIVDRIRDTIKEGKAKIGESKPGTGWEYCGLELSGEKSRLNQELGTNDFLALECSVLHLVRNGTIDNPTSHMLIIPLNGTVSLSKEEPLQPCHYINETRTIFGENIDIIAVALKKT
ncbi:hypothetical protein P170DRAFT_433923 [Aspergillus steynii IBT 23096]|uniref:Uncharacterized protein n=1 Tax=Aspergillus steynii IBT 23096 TaxID=1392250 RepID=A0A2I2GGP6_9EURO|nr:uncharacterized protein P170DRAFT_433923 [Aspergillus steynii IBT 23096]PLB52052.1 hypothetical protein P170DRAFT_433923 [Aspergillus steynii IBT 23096]